MIESRLAGQKGLKGRQDSLLGNFVVIEPDSELQYLLLATIKRPKYRYEGRSEEREVGRTRNLMNQWITPNNLNAKTYGRAKLCCPPDKCLLIDKSLADDLERVI